MKQIRLIGVSPRNGIKYDTFSTNIVINENQKESIRKALQKKYKREFFLYTADLDSDFKLPNATPFHFMGNVLT